MAVAFPVEPSIGNVEIGALCLLWPIIKQAVCTSFDVPTVTQKGGGMGHNDPTTKEELLEALDEAMKIIQGQKGVKLEADYLADVRYHYPKSMSRLAEQIGKLRSLVNHLSG